MTPRGERDNNPGNLEGAIPWQGLKGHDGAYDVFDTAENGIRALALDLLNQQRLHGLNTVGEIIPKFAPAADGNDVAAYIAAVCKYTGWAPDQRLYLSAFFDLKGITEAVIRHENGDCPYSNAQINDGIDAALNPKQEPSMAEAFSPAPSNTVQNTLTAGGGMTMATALIDYAVQITHLPPMPVTLETALAGVLVLAGHLLYKRLMG